MRYRTATQWGVYEVEVVNDRITAVDGIATDPHPSPIKNALADGVQHPLRIKRPAVRASWLKDPTTRAPHLRGREAFVELPWDEALELAAEEIQRVIAEKGNPAIFAGSYGWASAGRFHHAQSQLHRFLNLLGGCTRALNSYSTAAAQVILPHVLAPWHEMEQQQTRWADIAAEAELVVSFGGMPLRNSQVAYGGITEHNTETDLRQAQARGVRFVLLSPLRDDVADFLAAEWLPIRPGTDVACMLGLAHTLVAEGLVDRDFLNSHCVGYERFEPYLLGVTDGIVKDVDWAASICGLHAQELRTLAQAMAKQRTFVNAAWSLQRAEHGEQPYWMLVTLAAMLGQIGLTGRGVGFGYAAEGFVGSAGRRFNWATFSKGRNPTGQAIPVARITDMLNNPGTDVSYDGRTIRYPDVELIYWAGGNPFHHHQDLNRLLQAWQKPATVIVNEPWWTPIARHADIVFPATTALEREDLCASSHDAYAHRMQQAISAQHDARSDHDIFRGLAAALGIEEQFTEGRTPQEWLRHMWQRSEAVAREEGFELPSFDVFWQAGEYQLPEPTPTGDWLAPFRANPSAHPLRTPSGRIEIYSERIAGFGYTTCPPHPTWMEPSERLGGAGSTVYPLHLISNQPANRLHSQLDHSKHSQGGKIAGREALRMHPTTAQQRGLVAGDTVRVFNDRGQCLAGLVLDERMRTDVVVLPTGAWFDPSFQADGRSLELAGNPNVLTRDRGTSELAQGPSAHTCLVEVAAYCGNAPAPRVYTPPEFTAK